MQSGCDNPFLKRTTPEQTAADSANYHPQNALPWNGAVNPAVGAVVAIIAEDEILVHPANPHLFAIARSGVGRGVGSEIRFVEQFAVDEKVTFLDENGVAFFGDDAFDGVTVIGWVAQDDDVPWARFPNVVDETVQDIAFRIVQGGRHAGADDLDGLQNIVGDELKSPVCQRSNDQAGKNLSESTSKQFPAPQ